LYEQWASISDQEHCSVGTSSSNIPDSRISLVGDSRFAKGVAIHYHMNEGDKSCFSGRSELAMGTKFGETWPDMITRGSEGWYAFQVLFPATYPLNSETDSNGGVMQFHNYGGSGGGVPYGISAGRVCDGGAGKGTPHEGGPELGWLHAWVWSESEKHYKEFCLGKEIHANTVYNIVIHTRFTEESNGFCEVFLNGTRMMNYTGPFGLAGGVRSILRSGLYPDTARSESHAMDLYEAGWTLASTKEAAEANAFGPGLIQTPTPTPTPIEETLPHKHPKHAATVIAASRHQTAAMKLRAHRSMRHRSRTVRRRHYARHHHSRRHQRSHKTRR
jgi:hypothetical protein